MNNENVLLGGSRLRLVPYLAEHVPRYHQWMCNPEMMECTASERLTLEEEYANQKEWLCAEDKLTFIVLAPLSMIMNEAKQGTTTGTRTPEGNSETEDKSSTEADSAGEEEEEEDIVIERNGWECSAGLFDIVELQRQWMYTPLITPRSKLSEDFSLRSSPRQGMRERRIANTYVMVGDCNLFRLGINDVEEIKGEEKEDGKEKEDFDPLEETKEGRGGYFEVTVMIADRAFCRQGVGEETVRLLMSYAMDKLAAVCFIAKISSTNTPSIRFFTTKLGFTLLKEVPVFNELHYIRRFADAAEREAWMAAAGYTVDVYDANTENEMTVLHSLPEIADG